MTAARSYVRLLSIVGRPNVGKSCLFNRIIRERKSLVKDEPGVTRDRIFGTGVFENISFHVCDTGGFEPSSKDNIKVQLVEQAQLAIEESEVVIFVADGREGLHPIDQELVKQLRKKAKKFLVAVNKCDLPKDDILAEEFRKLGVDAVYPISAEHNRGIFELLTDATATFSQIPESAAPSPDTIKLALIGRPNVGKSSILNRIAGEARSIVDERPGTTRDTVDILLKHFGREIQVLDTAGIRRKSRMVDKIEKFSALRSVTCLEESHVAMLVIDATEGATEGDARVVGFAFQLRKPIIIVVNKWDLIENKTSKSTDQYVANLRIALRYIPYAPIIFVSAVENQRVSKLLPLAMELYDMGNRRIPTNKVNEVLKMILVKHTPPLTKNRSRRIKFLYATQVGVLPPRFVIFCADAKDLHFSYKRFVENEMREAFGFDKIPVPIVFRERTRKSFDERKEPRDLRKTLVPKHILLGDHNEGFSDDEIDDMDIHDIQFDDE